MREAADDARSGWNFSVKTFSETPALQMLISTQWNFKIPLIRALTPNTMDIQIPMNHSL